MSLKYRLLSMSYAWGSGWPSSLSWIKDVSGSIGWKLLEPGALKSGQGRGLVA